MSKEIFSLHEVLDGLDKVPTKELLNLLGVAPDTLTQRLRNEFDSASDTLQQEGVAATEHEAALVQRASLTWKQLDQTHRIALLKVVETLGRKDTRKEFQEAVKAA